MSDDNGGNANENVDTTENTGPSDKDTGSAEKTFTQADLDRIVADRIGREKAKYADYGDLKKKAAAAMTDQEKAVAEAEQRGRSAALAEHGSRLARAEFRAAAAGQLDQGQLDALLEMVDLKRFVKDDGEPDEKAIAAAIKKFAPANSGTTNFDGGARTTANGSPDFNQLLRQAAGRA